MSKLPPCAPPAVLSLSKDGPDVPAAVRRAHRGAGGERTRGAPWRRRVMACLGLAVIVLFALSANDFAQASWLAKVMGAAEQAAPRAGRLGGGALENAALHLRSLPVRAEGGAALAAQATQEGHWRFVNRAGETF